MYDVYLLIMYDVLIDVSSQLENGIDIGNT